MLEHLRRGIGCDELDLLVPRGGSRKKRKGVRCHVWSGEIPHGSFYELAPSVYASTPEFCFLQMAGRCSVAQLAQLGMELCGCYLLDSRQERGILRTQSPLTTPGKLARFLRGAQGAYGYAKARQALRWVVANSWSPMETDVFLLLCLPTKMGGYQLGMPELNHQLKLPEGLGQRAGKRHYYLDLYWDGRRGGGPCPEGPEGNRQSGACPKGGGRDRRRVALEFSGEADHFNRHDARRDRTREIIVQSKGIVILTITSYQVLRADQFDTLAKHLCSLLGKPYRAPTSSQMEKKVQLRRQLFARLGPDALIA